MTHCIIIDPEGWQNRSNVGRKHRKTTITRLGLFVPLNCFVRIKCRFLLPWITEAK